LPVNNRDSQGSPAPRRAADGFVRQLANVMDLPFVLVGSVVIAAGLGYLLDKRLGTSPILTLLLGALGFAGGMYELIRRLTGKRPPVGKPKDGQ
jgi:F0F1-type ATP synthase assembly protein I